MKSYFLLLRLNLRNLLAGFRGAMRKPNGKIDISRLILYPASVSIPSIIRWSRMVRSSRNSFISARCFSMS